MRPPDEGGVGRSPCTRTVDEPAASSHERARADSRDAAQDVTRAHLLLACRAFLSRKPPMDARERRAVHTSARVRLSYMYTLSTQASQVAARGEGEIFISKVS